MSYNHTLTITIPATLYNIGCSIARALDPDVGGAESFGPFTEAEEYTTSTPCTEEFYEKAKILLQNPSLLHAVVSSDYEERWKDFVPPSLQDCEDFVSSVTIIE